MDGNADNPGIFLPGSMPAPQTFVMPAMHDFPQHSMLHSPYPSSLAFWHNPHILKPVADPSLAAFQSPMAAAMIPEPKKHKRTRSGCFTCRQRRVKCDETRPICERCKKGKRDCVYPSPTEPKRESRPTRKASEKFPSIRESESEEDARHEHGQEHPSRQHGSRTGRPRSSVSRKRSSQLLVRTRPRHGTDTTSSTTKDASSSPSTAFTPVTSESLSPDTNLNFNSAISEAPSGILSDLPGAAGLRSDVQFFLAYRRQHITYRHYQLKPAMEKFLADDMLRLALEYEPLLYAIVGFTAYLYSVGQPNGKLYTLLQYYNKSVSLLLKSLQAGDPPSDAMLLTTLQLITFEEYLGDWVNLIDHHQAAHRMILELYTPEDICADVFHRHIVLWYSRYDVMAGLMAGNATVLSREWYNAMETACRGDVANSPGDLAKAVTAWSACNRKFAMEMASFLAKVWHGLISAEDYATEKQHLDNTLEELKRQLDAMKDPNYLVTSFPHQQPLGPEDIVDPYVPGLIYSKPLWELNHCVLETNGATLMYKYQLAMLTQNMGMFVELRDLAMSQLRIFETLLRMPDCPTEFPVYTQSILAFGALFLPSDETHQMWCRRRLAKVEQLGYVYPPTLRARLADKWKAPDVADWWLPNEEGYPNLVREVREWTNERTTNPRDNLREAVRDMRLIFGRMGLEQDTMSSQASSPSGQSAGYAERTPD
ncbi:hypothetical protein VTO42DRAFT_4836 [Malbranchea cinnamomea]